MRLDAWTRLQLALATVSMIGCGSASAHERAADAAHHEAPDDMTAVDGGLDAGDASYPSGRGDANEPAAPDASSEGLLDASNEGAAGDSTTGPSESVLNVHAALDEARAVRAMVMAQEGATFEAQDARGTRYTLSIPPNALVDDVEITMTPVAMLEALPFDSLTAGVQLEPDGLRFLRAVSLRITPADGAPNASQAGVSYHGDGVRLHLHPLEPSPSVLGFVLSHFSGYAVVSGSDPQLQRAASRTTTDAEDTLEQHLGAISPRQRRAALLGEPQDEPEARWLEETEKWFDENLAGPLSSPPASCDEGSTLELRALSWERSAALLGGEDALRGRMAKVEAYLPQVQSACWNDAIRPCYDAGDMEQRKRILRVQRTAAILGFDPSAFDESAAPACVFRGTITVSSTGTQSTQTGSATLNVTSTLSVTSSGSTTVQGDGATRPFTYTTVLDYSGSSDVSWSGMSDQRDAQPSSCGGEVVRESSSIGQASGSDTGTSSGNLIRHQDGTYELSFATIGARAEGTVEQHYAYTDPCIPKDDIVQDTSAPVTQGVASVGLQGNGNVGTMPGHIEGSATLPWDQNGTPMTATVTWSLDRSAP